MLESDLPIFGKLPFLLKMNKCPNHDSS
jgi:hypothetical protein